MGCSGVSWPEPEGTGDILLLSARHRLLWSVGDLQQGAKQIIVEFFSAHKADCKASVDLEISEAWCESLQQIKKEGMHFISQSSLSHLWSTESLRCLSREERDLEGREEKAEQKTSPCWL